MSAPPHPEEELRQEALDRLKILDTDAEERFNRLVQLAATVLDVPIVLVSLVDRDRQWFKARVGLDATETTREASFCAHAIVVDDGRPFLVEDTLIDERFWDNPLVTAAPNMRFYAGWVIHDPSGWPMGTVCAIDRRPRQFDDVQLAALGHVGWLVEQELQRVDTVDLAVKIAVAEHRHALILDTLTEGVVLQAIDGAIVEWNPAASRVLGLSDDELAGRTSTDPRWRAVHADGSAWEGETHPAMKVLRTGRPVLDQMMGVHHPDGTQVWLRVNSHPVLDAAGTVTHAVTAFADVTAEVHEQAQRQALETALAQSEEMARVSLDSLEQGVVLAEASGVVHRLNPAAEQVLGYSAEELSAAWGSPDWITYDEHGTVLEPHERPILIAIASGEPVLGRVIGWRRGDGTRILIRLSCYPGIGGDERFLVTFSDITQQHLAQRILDATFDAAPVGLALLEPDGSLLRCNELFSTLAGRPKAELEGEEVLSLLHQDDRAEAEDVGRRLMDGTIADGMLTQRVARPDGSEIWVKTSLATIDDPLHPMAIAAATDVTRERKLLQELARFGHLFRNANDMIVIVGRDGTVRYATPSCSRTLGYDPGHHFENGVLGVVDSGDLDSVAPVFRTLVGGAAEAGPATVRVHTASGELRYLECVAVNLLDEPDVRGIVITARDITERELLTQTLSFQTRHDVLTGLGNRMQLDDGLAQTLARAERDQRCVGLCFIDLDGFKAVNDTLGHAAGDDLLVSVADCIRTTIRAGDTAARVGGDEFVVVLDPITGLAAAMETAGRIRDAIVGLSTDSISIGASIGVAFSRAGDTPSRLLNRADRALYRAKAFHNSRVESAETDTPFG